MTSDSRGRRREVELARFGVLEERPGRDLQALVELAALVCDVSTAAINLVTSNEQHQVATVGFEPAVCAREDSMCGRLVDEWDPVVVADARDDDRFRDNPFVTGEVNSVRFYASAPLVTQRGVLIGRLCVFDTEPRALDETQTQALTSLADRVVDVLELRLRSRELEQSLGELIRTRDELHRSNRRLGFFAGQISHDLRTPLTAMLLNTESAVEEPAVAADEHVVGLLHASLAAGRRMSSLIDEILEFAQVGASLRMTDVDLERVVAAVCQDVRPALERRGGTLAVDPLPSLIADESQLYAVLLNLVSNAIKFAQPEVAPEVRVSAVRGDDRWRVVVTDNGIGVPTHQRSAVFLPFVRGEEGVEGSGIGLSTAKRIVEAHGGRVGLTAGPGGVGTTVWFEIPD